MGFNSGFKGLKTFLLWSPAMQLVLLPSEAKHAETATRRNEQSKWANRYLRNCTRTTRHLVSDASWRLRCMIIPFTKLAWGAQSFINLVYTSLRQIKFQCQIQESIHSVTSHALNHRFRCVHHMPNSALLPSLGDHKRKDCAKDSKNCYVIEMDA